MQKLKIVGNIFVFIGTACLLAILARSFYEDVEIQKERKLSKADRVSGRLYKRMEKTPSFGNLEVDKLAKMKATYWTEGVSIASHSREVDLKPEAIGDFLEEGLQQTQGIDSIDAIEFTINTYTNPDYAFNEFELGERGLEFGHSGEYIFMDPMSVLRDARSYDEIISDLETLSNTNRESFEVLNNIVCTTYLVTFGSEIVVTELRLGQSVDRNQELSIEMLRESLRLLEFWGIKFLGRDNLLTTDLSPHSSRQAANHTPSSLMRLGQSLLVEIDRPKSVVQREIASSLKAKIESSLSRASKKLSREESIGWVI